MAKIQKNRSRVWLATTRWWCMLTRVLNLPTQVACPSPEQSLSLPLLVAASPPLPLLRWPPWVADSVPCLNTDATSSSFSRH
jgi:hypothetical protein